MNWSGKNVFITGADGFIGSHLTEALVSEGANVTALCLYNSFDRHGWLDDVTPEIRDEMQLVRGDVRDAHQMDALCKNQTAVFHLASLIAIPYSYDAPSSYVQTNVQGTVNVLRAALNGGAARVIHTSTSEVYGTAKFTPISEDHPLQGQSPYSASKIGADMIAESFARSFNLPVVTLRPFNTYGPRQSERAVISTTIRQVLDDQCDVIKLGDLTPARDFNFVGDTVAAFLAAAQLSENKFGKAFNAGSGDMVTIAETVDLIRSITKSDKPVIQENVRMRPTDSEVMTLMADASRLKESTNWLPAVSLQEGLVQTIEWWRGHLANVPSGSRYTV
jgi:NAD dependent epimerase/dehydratase